MVPDKENNELSVMLPVDQPTNELDCKTLIEAPHVSSEHRPTSNGLTLANLEGFSVVSSLSPLDVEAIGLNFEKRVDPITFTISHNRSKVSMLQRTLNLLNQLMIPIHSDWMLYCKKLVFKDCKWNIIDILEKKSAVRSNANINFHIHLEDPPGLAPFSMLSCLEYTPVKSRKDCSYQNLE